MDQSGDKVRSGGVVGLGSHQCHCHAGFGVRGGTSIGGQSV